VLGPAGGLGAERRHGEHRGENRSSAAHIVTPSATVSISSLPVPSNVPAKSIWRERASGFREGRVWVRERTRFAGGAARGMAYSAGGGRDRMNYT
jgi:hypothetical protein